MLAEGPSDIEAEDMIIGIGGARIHRDEIRGQNGMTAAALDLSNTKKDQEAARGTEHAALNVFEVEVRP